MSGKIIKLRRGDKFRIGNQLVMVQSKGKLFCPTGGEKIVLPGAKSVEKEPLDGTIWEGR